METTTARARKRMESFMKRHCDHGQLLIRECIPCREDSAHPWVYMAQRFICTPISLAFQLLTIWTMLLDPDGWRAQWHEEWDHLTGKEPLL